MLPKRQSQIKATVLVSAKEFFYDSRHSLCYDKQKQAIICYLYIEICLLITFLKIDHIYIGILSTHTGTYMRISYIYVVVYTVPSANKKDVRTIEDVQADIQAKKRFKIAHTAATVPAASMTTTVSGSAPTLSMASETNEFTEATTSASNDACAEEN